MSGCFNETRNYPAGGKSIAKMLLQQNDNSCSSSNNGELKHHQSSSSSSIVNNYLPNNNLCDSFDNAMTTAGTTTTTTAAQAQQSPSAAAPPPQFTSTIKDSFCGTNNKQSMFFHDNNSNCGDSSGGMIIGGNAINMNMDINNTDSSSVDFDKDLSTNVTDVINSFYENTNSTTIDSQIDPNASSITSPHCLLSNNQMLSTATSAPATSSISSLFDSATRLSSLAEQSSTMVSNDYHNNGLVKKSSIGAGGKKKRVSSGPGRGRPRKAFVPMYHSQISGDKNTIKLRIKKNPTGQLPPNKRKTGRRKKHKAITSDTDASDYEQRRVKRSRPSGGNSAASNACGVGGENDVTSTQDDNNGEQSVWASHERFPSVLLEKIFSYTCDQDGCLPTLVRLGKVCRMWRDVSVSPTLWRKADLNYVKEKMRTDLRIHWLILNRLTHCQYLNLGEWKVRDIQAVVEALAEHCPHLRGLNLSGWKGLNADNLKYISTECKKLERLDLSSINSTSAINSQPLVALSQTMNTRLTHLVLAHNKIAGFTQIIAAIASHCPNLELLDISNIRTFAHNTALLHVEKLQMGCQKLRVLRITNSQIWLAPASLTDQVASPGFPMLEELSLAGLEEDQTTTSRSMDDDGIERLLKNSTKLRLLDVRGCSRLTDSGLVRVPAWDLEHLFLSACYITRLQNSGLELIVQKWSHSLIEVDLAWSTATESLDAAVLALAERGDESRLRVINLCGSSVSLEPVKAILMKCPNLHSINLQSCRALPRGIKRLYTGAAVAELRDSLSDRPKNETATTKTSTESDNEQQLTSTAATISPKNQ